MENFYLTFPQSNTARRNGWVRIVANNYDTALAIADSRFDVWCMLYADDFESEFFPDGELDVIQAAENSP